MKSDEEHDELWHLLGKAKQPQVSPFFARNILRNIREERQENGGILAWLRAHWRVPALAAGAAALLAIFAQPKEEPPSSDPLLLAAQQVSASPDYHVISNLDELLDSERNSIWLEASAY